MSNAKKHVAILGGGPCGLYAGRVLSQQGFRVTIIDKGERPGGLATSFHCGKNWYDYGVHMLHAFDQEIFEDIKGVMGDERIEVELNARIRWAGGSYRYPLQFQDMIKGIPFFKLCKQVFFLFGTQLKYAIFPKKPADAEQALIQLYGKPLYKFFFEDFTHRYWDLHPKQLSATFITTKMPKLTAVDVLKKGLEKLGIKPKVKAVESALTSETLHYSRTGAETMTRCLAKSIQDANNDIILNANVKQVTTNDEGQVSHIHYEKDGKTHEIECDECISTIPVSHLVHAMQPASPAHVINAANNLRYKAIVIYGLLVKKQQCMDGLYVYYRDRIFHRVGEPKNAGMNVEPSDHTVLIVEMTCEVGDAKWNGEESIKQRVFDDLAAEGICTKEDIVEMHINHYQNGYPIFELGFEENLDSAHSHIRQFKNLQTTGRQGDFTYPNMHSAMRMGATAANNIIERNR